MIKVAVLGPEGTFSDVALKQYKHVKKLDINIKYYNKIEDVLHNIEELAIIPIENALDGYLYQCLDMLLELDLEIVDELSLDVKFSLLGNCSNTKDIRRLFVQYKAKGQCSKFISKLENPKIVITDSNIESFNSMADGYDACVVPYHIIHDKRFALRIENITDSDKNYTRFFIIKKKTFIYDSVLKEDCKVSLCVYSKKDKPGLLVDILSVFVERNINLISIMSRPNREHLGSYNFFIEASCAVSTKETINDLIECFNKSELFGCKLLGTFSNI